MSDFLKRFENSCSNYPENIAITYNDLNFSYQQICQATDLLAQALVKMGFQKGNRIAIILPNYVQFPICVYAILKAGAVAFPINFMFSESQLRNLLQRTEIKGIITCETFLKKVEAAATDLALVAPLIVLGKNIKQSYISLTELFESTAPEEQPIEIANDDAAIILHSSAATGDPKAAEISHAALDINCNALKEQFNFNANDSFIVPLPLFHPLALVSILGTSFSFGSRIHLLPYFDPQKIVALIRQQRITAFFAIPSIYKALLETDIDSDSFDSVRVCLAAWQTCPDSLLRAFKNKFNRTIFQAYGLIEATALVTINRIDPEKNPESVGLPVANFSVRIVDEQNQELAIGEIGEIVLQGPGLMKDYVGNINETITGLRDEWLHTGDLGKFDDTGNLYFIDRRENIITRGGFHVFPEELEAHLANHPKIKEAAIIGFPDAIHGEEVKACIVPTANEMLTSEEVIEYCRQAFAVYKCPSIVEFYTSLPKSPTGKILKYHLKKNRAEKAPLP